MYTIMKGMDQVNTHSLFPRAEDSKTSEHRFKVRGESQEGRQEVLFHLEGSSVPMLEELSASGSICAGNGQAMFQVRTLLQVDHSIYFQDCYNSGSILSRGLSALSPQTCDRMGPRNKCLCIKAHPGMCG